MFCLPVVEMILQIIYVGVGRISYTHASEHLMLETVQNTVQWVGKNVCKN